MPVLRMNWLYFGMAASFNSIEAFARMYDANQEELERREMERALKNQTYIPDDPTDESYKALSQAVSWAFSNWHPRVLAYSTVSMAFSAAEYWTEELTCKIKEDKGHPVSSRDFAGSPIGRAKKFGQVYSLPEIPATMVSLLAETKLLRDCIVHANGYVGACKNAKSIEQLAARGDGVSVASDGSLDIALDHAISLVDRIGNDVATLYKSWGYGPTSRLGVSRPDDRVGAP